MASRKSCLGSKISGNGEQTRKIDVTGGVGGVWWQAGTIAKFGPIAAVGVWPSDGEGVIWNRIRKDLEPVDEVLTSKCIWVVA